MILQWWKFSKRIRQQKKEDSDVRLYAALVHSQLWYYYSACRRRLYFIDKEKEAKGRGRDVRHVCIIISYKHFIFCHSFHEDLSLNSYSEQGNNNSRELASYRYCNWTRVTSRHEQSTKIWSKRRFSIVRRQFKILFVGNTRRSVIIGWLHPKNYLREFSLYMPTSYWPKYSSHPKKTLHQHTSENSCRKWS